MLTLRHYISTQENIQNAWRFECTCGMYICDSNITRDPNMMTSHASELTGRPFREKS